MSESEREREREREREKERERERVCVCTHTRTNTQTHKHTHAQIHKHTKEDGTNEDSQTGEAKDQAQTANGDELEEKIAAFRAYCSRRRGDDALHLRVCVCSCVVLLTCVCDAPV